MLTERFRGYRTTTETKCSLSVEHSDPSVNPPLTLATDHRLPRRKPSEITRRKITLLLEARLSIRYHASIPDLLALDMARVLLEMRPDRVPCELHALAVVAPQDNRCPHP
jgi:hypothetical protein